MIALLTIRRLASAYGWTPQQVLDAPAQLVRDLLTAEEFRGKLGR